MTKPKVALATEFLVQYGGAQKTLEAISEIYPDAPIYTAKYSPGQLSKYLNSKKIIAPKNSLISKASKFLFALLMAPIFEDMDFRDFDIVLSGGTTWTKGILTKPDQLHISYIHTPPRFLYGYSREAGKRDFFLLKLFFSYMDNILRLWDFTAAQRPDFLLTNSKVTQQRIWKFYRRNATVIYPPVEINTIIKTKDEFRSIRESIIDKPYYLLLGRIVKYKNFDLVINAFNLMDLNLVIAGTGSEEAKLRKIAGKNVKFTGQASEDIKHALLDGALGVINPVEDEDFGIVPIEAFAHGIPVLAHKSGGHMETVEENKTGLFFETLSIEELVKKVKEFDTKIKSNSFDRDYIRQHAEKFSKERFQKDYMEFVADKWEQHCAAHNL